MLEVKKQRKTLTWGTFLFQCDCGMAPMASKRSRAVLTGGLTLIYLIPEAPLHLQLTSDTHCTALMCVGVCMCLYLGQYSACFCFYEDNRRCTGSFTGDLILPSPQLPRLIPQGQATCPHVHTHTHKNTSFNYRFIGWGKVPGKMGDIEFQMDQGWRDF